MSVLFDLCASVRASAKCTASQYTTGWCLSLRQTRPGVALVSRSGVPELWKRLICQPTQKQGGPYGPGSFARSLNLKEEEM